MSRDENWDVVIGLEIHAQLQTKSKLFSGAANSFAAGPNENVSIVDIGMPGTLPTLNLAAVQKIVRTGLAIGSNINMRSAFDRKHYFYPDLALGYQITQFYEPILKDGVIRIKVKGENKDIGVRSAHLEQDAGKSIHGDIAGKSFIDFNRAGVPLMELVTHPQIKSSEEAVEFVKKLRAIMLYVGSCDGSMENGSLRCDANVSVRRKGEEKLGTRREIKNLNSLRSIAAAIEYEIDDQISILESGGKVMQETRLFNVDKGETRKLRSKEDTDDYRYFPDPDLPIVLLDDEFIEEQRKCIPELPDEKVVRYLKAGLTEDDACIITSDPYYAQYFDRLASAVDTKMASNWMLSELFGRLKKMDISLSKSPVSADSLAELIKLISSGVISGKIAKDVLDIMMDSADSPEKIVKDRGLVQIMDPDAIRVVVREVLSENTDKVLAYKQGKDKLFGFFVGQVLRQMGGKANPEMVNKIIKEEM